MKYTEFEGIICHLGKEYDVDQNNNNYIYVIYKGTPILDVDISTPFILDVDISTPFILETHPLNEFNACPKKLEIWNAAVALAATPIDEREEEKKYNVIIGNDDTNCSYIVWSKDDMKGYFLCPTDSNGLREDPDFQFTESEYQDLLKCIETLPQGDKQVEIAKIGKTLVK